MRWCLPANLFRGEANPRLICGYSRHVLTGGEIFLKVMNDDDDDPIARPFLGRLPSVAGPKNFF